MGKRKLKNKNTRNVGADETEKQGPEQHPHG